MVDRRVKRLDALLVVLTAPLVPADRPRAQPDGLIDLVR
jgi:hypothetical protein